MSLLMKNQKKKYVSEDEKLMSEWHWEKNNSLGFNPNKITYGSAKKVWWKCANGHEWDASPNHRSRGRSCPYCAKSKRAITLSQNLVARRGSLADNNPELAAQWHPTKNGDLTPDNFTTNSTQEVWWICKKGHEWNSSISRRTSGEGCPVCSGHRIVVGINDLATVNPILAKQWHPTKNGGLKPTDVTCGSDQKVWWICDKGHEWEARINNRQNGNNCPICIGKKVLVGFNDLATTVPELAKEWHPTKNNEFTPQNFTKFSNKKVWWICSKGHEWKTAISKRSNGQGCPKCFDESRTSFPEQAIFFYFKQFTPTVNRFKLDSRTEIDVYLTELKIGIEYDGNYFHTSEKAIERELRKQQKLDKLGITLIRVKETDTTLDSTTQDNIIYSKIRYTDEDLHQTIKSLFAIIKRISNVSFNEDINIERDRSKIYEQFIESEKQNSLAVVNPKLASEWHPTKNGNLSPESVPAGSNKKVWWQCQKGHEWQAVINSRRNNVGCPYCTGKKAIAGINDLATVNPNLANQWHPTKNGNLTPREVTANSNKKVWWICDKGHEWEAKIYDRNRGSNCSICSGHKVLVGYNDLSTTHPALASEWHPSRNNDLKPTDVTHGSDKKVWWQCSNGHEWQATISSRSSGCGCSQCAILRRKKNKVNNP